MTKPCKFGCGQELAWDDAKKGFKEKDGTEHSKERCAYMKSLLPKASPPPAAQPAPAPQQQQQPPISPSQRDTDIANMHREKMNVQKSLVTAITGQTEATRAHTVAIEKETLVLDQIRMHLETIARDAVKAAGFMPAKTLATSTPPTLRRELDGQD